MGFYDYRCSLTGVSLKVSDAVFLPLLNESENYVPLALGMKGSYNRLGSIDRVKPDPNSESILKFFRQALESGEFVFDERCIRGIEIRPIKNIEDLLTCIERHVNDSPNPAHLNGRPVVYALIERKIWESIVEHSKVAEDTSEVMWESLFPGSSVGGRIYEGVESNVIAQLRELYVVTMEMKTQGIEWAPVDDPFQHYGEEMTEFFKEAKTRFKDAPLFLDALAAYEDEVSEFLEDEEDE